MCLNETTGCMQGKLAAINKAKQGQGDGLEGRRNKMNQMNQALYINPYDACAASEGTQEIPMHGIPLQHNSPWPALSLDSAAALTPIISVVEKMSSEQQTMGRQQMG
jgi:hypothetical protein